MTHKAYSTASANMMMGIEDFINNKFVKDFIPKQILESLQLLIAFFNESKYHVFVEGKLLNLSVWNVLRWYKFIKIAHKFVRDLVEIWK
jgi:hypothetical protein